MARLFNRYVGIDYSGAETPSSSLKREIVTRDANPPLEPHERLVAEIEGWILGVV